jgi:serine/threonine protein phosphatase PrpC
MKVKVRHAGLTDQGRVREQNEDTWAADQKEGLYLVSDGIGGQVAGAMASRIVAETLPGLIRQGLSGISDLADPAATRRVGEAISQLSRELQQQTHGKPGLEGMGATVVLGLVRNSKALIAHMGDSRAYLWRKGRLEQLTKDHSIIQLLLDNGEIKPEEVSTHPARGWMTRSVGMAGEPLPELRLLDLHPGDRLLLCTDGLTAMVSDVVILSILNGHSQPKEICRRLVDAANEAGGKDNITVVLVVIAGGESESACSPARQAQRSDRKKTKATGKRLA